MGAIRIIVPVVLYLHAISRREHKPNLDLFEANCPPLMNPGPPDIKWKRVNGLQDRRGKNNNFH